MSRGTYPFIESAKSTGNQSERSTYSSYHYILQVSRQRMSALFAHSFLAFRCKHHMLKAFYPTPFPTQQHSCPSELLPTLGRIPTISPQTTSCRHSPLLSLPVKNPSLPASSSLQSLANSCSTGPARWSTCSFWIPNCMQRPMRRISSSAMRGLLD